MVAFRLDLRFLGLLGKFFHGGLVLGLKVLANLFENGRDAGAEAAVVLFFLLHVHVPDELDERVLYFFVSSG